MPRAPGSSAALDLDAGGNRLPRAANRRGCTQRGHKVTLFNRGKTRPGLFPELEKLHGDRDLDDLKALEGRKWDAVVDTSANVPRWVKKAAAVLGPNIGHYVYISSVSVYVDTEQARQRRNKRGRHDRRPDDRENHWRNLRRVESPD